MQQTTGINSFSLLPTMDTSPQSQKEKSSGSTLTTLIICGSLLLLGSGVIGLIYLSEPTASRTTATKKSAMPVNVIRPEQGTFRPVINVQGTVKPSRNIILRPRVQGKVIEKSTNFTPGGFVEKDETLVRLDSDDYQNTLTQRKSTLQEAIKNLKIEKGRQDIAQQEYDLLDENLSTSDQKLVLRKPQLQAARAEVESARSAVEQARLELERTKIKAPFDAQVLTRDVNIGSQVSAGDRLARLVGTHTYWVEAKVPLSKLRWLSFSRTHAEEGGSDVKIRNRTAWPEQEYRNGQLQRQIGYLQEKTRMATVLITVPDPLARKPENQDKPAMIIGSYVEARIQGKPISDVAKLNRDYLRDNDTVWLFQEGKLRIRKVDVAYRDSTHAYIRKGLSRKNQVVTTNLTTISEGIDLRRKDSESQSPEDTE